MTLDAAVIIPTCGTRPELLRRALTSVAAQTRPPSETWVVVDGDEGLRARVASAARAPWASFVSTGRAAGASAARNLGATRSKAQHLCFLDDDDVWKPVYLEAVFAADAAFDLALTAFEKHTHEGARPEKVPPVALCEEAFRVANPGLRGSNVVIARETFVAVGGFDEGLVSFNDMDFGVRLARLGGVRYRRIERPLVEYHAHDGARLSRRGSPSVEPGMLAYLDRHEPAMTVRERVAFRERAVSLWGIDPWAPERVVARAERAMRDGMLTTRFPGLLLALETALLEATAHSDDRVDDLQCAVDRLCQAWECARGAAGRLDRLRVVVITTDAPEAPDRLIASLVREVERAGWCPAARGSEPWLDVLVLENNRATVGPSERSSPAWLPSWARVVRCPLAPGAQAPLPISHARPRAFEHVIAQGWAPSARAPVWFLDEDFRFDVLLPSRGLGYRRAPGGSVLHRFEQLVLAAEASGVAMLVGGNSFAAPVPAAGLLRRQLADLWCIPAAVDDPWGSADAVRARLARVDAYYDLSVDPVDDALRPGRSAWWRGDGVWDWDEVFERLRRGLPVTRPALPPLVAGAGAAWGALDAPRVSGGNVVLLDRAALRPDLFASHTWRGLVSRRGDSVWCVRAQRVGARAWNVSLPLAHDRGVRAGDPVALAARDTLADALGFGLYRAYGAGDAPIERDVTDGAESRRRALTASLGEALETVTRDPRPADMPERFVADVKAMLLGLLGVLTRERFEEGVKQQ